MTQAREEQPIVSKAQSHIIERPRLTKLLDETESRIITLVAPAGYGKTTLARQWLRDKRVAWHRATQASADVAALAMGVGDAAAELIPGAGERMKRRLATSQAPAMKAEGLAEMLSRDLAKWPQDAWLVIDDYQFAEADASAAAFVDALTDLAPVRLLLTSRERPSWVTSRRLLYGEILELGQSELALTDNEVTEVLHLDNSRKSKRLLHGVKGWPAVIGLAAITNDFDLPNSPLPLYDFFADELYHAAPAEIRSALRRFAVLPVLAEDLAALVLGEPARDALDEGIRLGFLSSDSRDGYELHPLLRQFLLDKLLEEKDDLGFVRQVACELMRLDLWDDVFTLIERFRLDDYINDLLDHGLSAILRVGRLMTVERWVEYAKSATIESPLEFLAEAEIFARRGVPATGELLALQAASALKPDDPYASRSFAVAGACAYRQMNFPDALDHHKRAEKLARSDADARTALWGQFIASVALELDALPLLDLYASLAKDDPSARLRLAGGHIHLSSLNGRISRTIDLWGRLVPLVEKAEEPLSRSYYCYQVGASLNYAGRYGEAIPILQVARREAEANGFESALHHISNAEAGARIGLRQFTRARTLLDHVSHTGRTPPDPFAEFNARLLHARTHLCRGRLEDALRVFESLSLPTTAKGLVGEYLALYALSVAAAGQWERADALAAEARSVTMGVEAQTLSRLVDAVVALKTQRTQAAEEALNRASATLLETENLDSLVIAYRVFPCLLESLGNRSDWQPTVEKLVIRANDSKLGEKAKLVELTKRERVGLPLTRREREVFELLCQGLTNKEIAERLFIEEVTAKAHVRNILAKLGCRSRTEAVLRAHAEE